MACRSSVVAFQLERRERAVSDARIRYERRNNVRVAAEVGAAESGVALRARVDAFFAQKPEDDRKLAVHATTNKSLAVASGGGHPRVAEQSLYNLEMAVCCGCNYGSVVAGGGAHSRVVEENIDNFDVAVMCGGHEGDVVICRRVDLSIF